MSIRLARSAAVVAAACLTFGPACAAPEAGEQGTMRLELLPASAAESQLLAQATPTLKGFVGDIEDLTEGNSNYRQVLYTGHHLQLVLMALKPGEAIGEETHKDRDQFFRVEEGEGEIVINGVSHRLTEGSAALVPAGARHNLRNVGKEPLKLYTLYGPPEHRRDVVQRTKADAERHPRHFDGKASE